MSEDVISELSDAVAASGGYLTQLDVETRAEVVTLLNSRIYDYATPHDLLSLVLVMADLRPACIVSVRQEALSLEHAEELAQNKSALTACTLVGQFLETYDIPFVLRTRSNEGRAGEPAAVSLIYHISFDNDRLEQVPAYSEVTADSDLSRETETAIGRFLDYPEPAIEAYCDRDHMEGEHLVDALSDDELAEALGDIVEVYDAMDLDYRAFTKFILPYVVPETASDCTDRMQTDVTRFIVGGLIASEEYDISLFEQVLADYRDRFAPES